MFLPPTTMSELQTTYEQEEAHQEVLERIFGDDAAMIDHFVSRMKAEPAFRTYMRDAIEIGSVMFNETENVHHDTQQKIHQMLLLRLLQNWNDLKAAEMRGKANIHHVYSASGQHL